MVVLYPIGPEREKNCKGTWGQGEAILKPMRRPSEVEKSIANAKYKE